MIYLCNSVAWSVAGFALGGVLGYLLRLYEGTPVTTAERLRRRQIRESVGVALIALGLVGSTIYFAGQDAAQDRCLSTFVNTQTDRQAVRSDLVEQESQATRAVITRTLMANGQGELDAAYREYKQSLERIDDAREANPVVAFPEGLCN